MSVYDRAADLLAARGWSPNGITGDGALCVGAALHASCDDKREYLQALGHLERTLGLADAGELVDWQSQASYEDVIVGLKLAGRV